MSLSDYNKRFTTVQSDLIVRNGQPCKIIRDLDDTEADLIETGPMHEVEFIDGHRITVYADELS